MHFDIKSPTLELEEVHILSRAHASSFRCARPWACVSIATEATDFAEIDESNRIDLLQIAFADLEQEPSPLTLEVYPELKDSLFNTFCAERILDFAERVFGHISVLMVHCALGQSRSPAVTASLLGIEPRLLEGTSPNRLVYALLEDCKRARCGWRGFHCSAEGRIFGTELVGCGSSIRGDNGTRWTVLPAEIDCDQANGVRIERPND